MNCDKNELDIDNIHTSMCLNVNVHLPLSSNMGSYGSVWAHITTPLV